MGKKAIILATVCAMIIVVVFFQFIVFKPLQPKDYYAAYYSEFNTAPPVFNSPFSPPVSIYQALLIALNSRYWNGQSLKNMSVRVELDYYAYFKNLSTPSGWLKLGSATYRTNPPVSGTTILYQVTQPPADWKPQQVNNITYRYVWTITVQYAPYFDSAGVIIPSLPCGWFQVDAATAELVEPGFF